MKSGSPSLSRRSLLAAGFYAASAPRLLAARGDPGRSIRIAATPTAILVWLADAVGLFREAGVDVSVQRYTSGTLTAPAVLAGEAELGTSSEYAFISKAFERSDLRVLASISQSRTISLFGNADRGLDQQSNLKGKILAVVPNSFADFVLERLLLTNDVRPAEVLKLRPPEIVSAAISETIDGGVVWDPYLREISIELGDRFVELSNPAEHEYHFLLHGMSAWFAENEGPARAVLRGLLAALRMAEDSPEAARRILAQRLEIDLEIVEYLWPKHTLRLGLSQGLLRLMEDEAWFRVERGLSQGAVPNFLQFLHADPLLAEAPETVSVIGLR
ncbi:MAG: ABC transporter substrate-binding protein [Pseudomonadota bacterium]